MGKNVCNVQAKFEIEELCEEVQESCYDSLAVIGVKDLPGDTMGISIATTSDVTPTMTIALLHQVIDGLVEKHGESVMPPKGLRKTRH